MQVFRQWGQSLGKPLLFGVYGAIGCLLSAGIFGEILLTLTKLPPSTQSSRTPVIVLLIDTSSSMRGAKLQEVKDAAQNFVAGWDLSRSQIALVSFATDTRLEARLTHDRQSLEKALVSLRSAGGTNMGEGLQAATQALQPALPKTSVQSHILLFTDGLPTSQQNALNAATAAKRQNINLIAVGTGGANRGFLSQLTGDSDKVFFANAGDIDRAFQQAGEVIARTQLVDTDPGNYGLLDGVLRIGGWTGILTVGLTLALVMGQNRYLRRRLLTWTEGGGAVMGGFVAGLVGGGAGELLYLGTLTLPFVAAIGVVGPLLGWTILGLLVGKGLSVFVPNLSPQRALVGGGLGGFIGALGFLAATGSVGVFAGRLLGATILGFFLGVMIAFLEHFARDAWLVVEWSPTEQRRIPLGAEPILLGSSEKAHIYLRRDQGYPPITAQIYQEGEVVVMEYDEEMRSQKSMQILRHELNDGDRRKLGDVLLKIKISERALPESSQS